MRADTVNANVWKVGDRVAVEMETRYGRVHSLAADGSTVDIKMSDGRVFRIAATSAFLRRQP
jgi:hypothetical protein